MKFLFALFLIIGGPVLAEPAGVLTADETFQREGRYTKVTIMMGDPIKIFVAGKERMRIGASDLKLEVRKPAQAQWEELKLNESGNYYSVKNPAEEGVPQLLEVRTTLMKKKKSETFSVPVNPKP
jgi:hypothetical protein